MPGEPFVGIFKSKFLECEQICHLANNNENSLTIMLKTVGLCVLYSQYVHNEVKQNVSCLCMAFSFYALTPKLLKEMSEF